MEKQIVNPSDIATSIVNVIGEKFPTARVGDIEVALAMMIYDMEDRMKKDGTEYVTVPMEESINDMLYMSRGKQNTFVRIGNDIMMISARIKEILEKQKEEEEKKKAEEASSLEKVA